MSRLVWPRSFLASNPSCVETIIQGLSRSPFRYHVPSNRRRSSLLSRRHSSLFSYLLSSSAKVIRGRAKIAAIRAITKAKFFAFIVVPPFGSLQKLTPEHCDCSFSVSLTSAAIVELDLFDDSAIARKIHDRTGSGSHGVFVISTRS